MYIFLIVVYAILCLALIGLILLQRGRGSQTGLTYDPQSSVFGSSGSVSFLVKLTTVFAILFLVLGVVISINFRDSISTAPQSLLDRTVELDEAEDEAEDSDDPASTLEDVPAASVDGAVVAPDAGDGGAGDVPTEAPADDIPSPDEAGAVPESEQK